MKLGSLFSGAGLGDLGWMMAGFDIRWQVEIDPYCRKILDLRFPEAKKYDDIKKVKGSEIEPVDIVAGGFPCQPFSVAGKQRGTADDRNLWPQMLRVVKEVRPTWVVGENVSGIIPIYLDTILADLEAAGYATRTFVFPAHALGANHRRERIWVVGYAGLLGQKEHEKQTTGVEQSGESIIANTTSERWDNRRDNRGERPILHNQHGDAKKNKPERHRRKYGASEISKNVADTTSNGRSRNERLQQDGSEDIRRQAGAHGTAWQCGDDGQRWKNYWKSEPGVGRVAHGCPGRVDRLKALGNGQVSVCTYFIGRIIMDFEGVKNNEKL